MHHRGSLASSEKPICNEGGMVYHLEILPPHSGGVAGDINENLGDFYATCANYWRESIMSERSWEIIKSAGKLGGAGVVVGLVVGTAAGAGAHNFLLGLAIGGATGGGCGAIVGSVVEVYKPGLIAIPRRRQANGDGNLAPPPQANANVEYIELALGGPEANRTEAPARPLPAQLQPSRTVGRRPSNEQLANAVSIIPREASGSPPRTPTQRS